MARQRGLTSIPTPTHIWPTAPSANLVRVDLPEPDGYDYTRALLVPREIKETLQTIVDRPKMKSTLQRFIGGLYVAGSMHGDRRSLRPDFERLENLDEVWVMCFRQPKFEQWRLMGRFAGFNAFVGLALFRREYLDGDQRYQSIATDFANRWPISAIPIHRGNVIGDYISMPVRDPYAQSVI
jgi:hypothetical protein